MPAGSGTDLIARAVLEGARRHLPNNQPLVPVNRPGAAGIIAAEYVSRARPDGYTILFHGNATLVAVPHFGVARFSHDTFQKIIGSTEGMHIFMVRADSPWKTFDQFIEYARKNPGKIAYGTPGAGTMSHIGTEYMNKKLGLNMVHVPFAGGAEAQTALLGGHVDAAGLLAIGTIDRARLRVLANFGTKKSQALRDVPLLSELGFETAFPVLNGFLAPKGTPPEIVAVLHDAIKKAIEDPEIIQLLERINAVPNYHSTEEWQRYTTETFFIYRDIMRTIGLT